MSDEQTPTSKPQDYTKRPVTIQAIKWTGTNLRDVIAFTDGPPNTRSHHAGMMWERYEDLVSREGLKIHAIEGVHTATVGDMIIKGVRGEFYFCNAEIFEETYSPAAAMQPALAEAKAQGRNAGMREVKGLFSAHPWSWSRPEIHEKIDDLINTTTEEPK